MSESFPYDWLAPSDIRYCYCGYNLIDIKNGQQVCAKCSVKNSLYQQVGEDEAGHPVFGRVVSDKDEVDHHDRLWDEACKLAQSRKDSGMVRLHWMVK